MLLSNGDNLWGRGRGGEEEETGSSDLGYTWNLRGMTGAQRSWERRGSWAKD